MEKPCATLAVESFLIRSNIMSADTIIDAIQGNVKQMLEYS